MLIYDSHIHVGQFYEKYYSPEYIMEKMLSLKIHKALVSSTTTCDENYEKIILEIKQLVSIGHERILPVLWVTPKMLKNYKLSFMLDTEIEWKCIKIHGLIHNWAPNGKLFRQVIVLALKLQVPILIHSGGDKKCDAGSYLRVIKKHPLQKFILAHGRPIDEAVSILKQTTNAYVDTAFMPLENIEIILNNGFEDKILFGTDFPITIHNEKNLSDVNWYQTRISQIVDIIGVDKFELINAKNFNRLFC